MSQTGEAIVHAEIGSRIGTSLRAIAGSDVGS
jgi:hypothetical protein